jgi:hypothetical protein
LLTFAALASCVNRANAVDPRVPSPAPDQLALAAPKIIRGVVVDTKDNPVAGASIEGRWGRFGVDRLAHVESDDAGRFELRVDYDVAYYLKVLAHGYVEYDEQLWDQCPPHFVGANDVRVVLHEPVLTTFAVLDASTSQPIKRFGVKVIRRVLRDWNGAMLEAEDFAEHAIVEHLDGRFTCEADPARHDVCFEASGYVSPQTPVAHESATSAVQVVRLAKGSKLRGRVLSKGAPVRGAIVSVWQRSLVRFAEKVGGSSSEFPFEEDDWYYTSDGPVSPSEWIDDAKEYRTNAEGRFEASNFAGGEMRVVIVSDTGARRVFDPLAIEVSSDLDLGDIALLDGCSLRGKLLVPPGTSPRDVGLGIWNFGRTTDTWHRNEHATADENGDFYFEFLTAGAQHLIVENKPGVLWSSGEHEYKLSPGEHGEIVIDLRDATGCQVQARVRVDGDPLVDAGVEFVAREGKRWTPGLWRTDREGRASNWCAAVGSCDVIVKSCCGLPLAILPRGADFIASGSIELDIDAHDGNLVLEWPALDGGLPAQSIELVADVKEPFVHRFNGNVSPRSQYGKPRMLADNRCDFGPIMPGTYDCRLIVSDRGSFCSSDVPNYQKTVTISAGETTQCVLTERERVH